MIAIIGAGIAGLTAALSFSKLGFKSALFERAQKLEETGASIQLSPNATHILSGLGLNHALSRFWNEPEFVSLTDARSLTAVAQVPVGDFAKNQWNAPHANLKRADLQKILLDAVFKDPNISLHLGQTLNFQDVTCLKSAISEIMGEVPSLIVGADGVWSKVRDLVDPNAKPVQTPHDAWRFEASHQVRRLLPDHIAQSNGIYVFLSRKAHIVFYPEGYDGKTNIVFVTNQTASHDASNASDVISSITMHPSIKSCLMQSDQLGCWPIYEVDCAWWHGKRHNSSQMVLIGDAAHAMSPYMAQGAAMAIEDAHVLAQLVADHSSDIAIALQSYEHIRRPRISRVKKRAEFNKFAYHASGPVKFARNRLLGIKSSESLAMELDWLYGWQWESGPRDGRS